MRMRGKSTIKYMFKRFVPMKINERKKKPRNGEKWFEKLSVKK